MNITTTVVHNSSTNDWHITVSTGDWDTYKEAVYFGPTKPTQREIRKVVKAAKTELVPVEIPF